MQGTRWRVTQTFQTLGSEKGDQRIQQFGHVCFYPFTLIIAILYSEVCFLKGPAKFLFRQVTLLPLPSVVHAEIVVYPLAQHPN